MSRVLTGTEFYDLVWSKPMPHLGKKFANQFSAGRTTHF